ncbi:hypothetical protein K488DRAFT_14497, partial [Vararia minispora EC-137]
VLRAPARLTNLAVLILAGTALISILLNVFHWSASTSGAAIDFESSYGLPPSIAATFARPAHARALDHLVLVPGHGVWLGSREEDVLDEGQWLLAEYQRNRGRPATLLSHIQKAVEIATEDPGALLIFSGGQTTFAPMTEAESYANLALAAGLLYPLSEVSVQHPPYHTTERYALDSFQNLLFALARFREYTGRFPTRISVIGYAFKGARFRDLHARAIGWPEDRFEYIGVPLPDAMDEAKASEGETANAFLPYLKDLYGCRSPLSDKRMSRNLGARPHAYHVSAPELAGLLEWCPSDGTVIYAGPLPW